MKTYVCPFCNGSKIKPFLNQAEGQVCKECDSKGRIGHKDAKRMGILDFCRPAPGATK